MISMILTSRVDDNEDTNIFQMLDSLVNCCSPKNIEVLIKYDSDDAGRKTDADFKHYPFPVKTFCWSRGEGRHSFHNDHMYLFSETNPQSKFLIIGSDDFTFFRCGFDLDILNIKEKYAFVGQNALNIEACDGRLLEPKIYSYWKHNGYDICSPCMTVRTAEVLQNMGWQCNADNWETLLVMMMYQDYKINLWHKIPNYIVRNESKGNSGFKPSYNRMEIDGFKDCQNPRYFSLISQQVRNLYLNIKEDGL